MATSVFTVDVVDFALLYLLVKSQVSRVIVTTIVRSRDLLG